MCRDSRKFIEEVGAKILKIREAVMELAEFGLKNPDGVACEAIRRGLYDVIEPLAEPLQQMNFFVVLYAETHGVQIPDGFKQPQSSRINLN
jgi:hypothetical protein